MAYMNQEKKKAIASALKEFMPKNWKYSLSVSNHSTLCMTIKSAPIWIIADKIDGRSTNGYCTLNHYWMHESPDINEEAKPLLDKIKTAMNMGNWDNSDSQSDYFDVGHYISITVGAWNKPFELTA